VVALVFLFYDVFFFVGIGWLLGLTLFLIFHGLTPAFITSAKNCVDKMRSITPTEFFAWF